VVDYVNNEYVANRPNGGIVHYVKLVVVLLNSEDPLCRTLNFPGPIPR
jgi:hypothetical protein